MLQLRKFVVTNLWWLGLVLATALFIEHGFGFRFFVVDNISLVLLALIFLSPFLAAIKKVKFGDFEAEIDSEEVQAIAEKTKRALTDQESPASITGKRNSVESVIRSLSTADPVIALAKVRIEIEARLRRLQSLSGQEIKAGRGGSLSRIIGELVQSDVFSSQLANALTDVLDVCNRAIHGQDISQIDAKRVIESGINLIGVLENETRSFVASSPAKKDAITSQQSDAYRAARYRVLTVVPLVKRPTLNEYTLTQDELDEFLDGYSDFAEFLVGIEKLDQDK